jgi:hypothetical protein
VAKNSANQMLLVYKKRSSVAFMVCLTVESLFMLLVQEFMITGSLSQIKKTFPPEPWDEFEKQISVQKGGAKDVWDSLTRKATKVTKEKDLYTIFFQLLQKAGYKFWQDDNNDHRKAVSVPDFVIYRGDKWDPSNNADRLNVIIDIEIKQRFNTINLTAATTKRYPGDAGMAYVQALKRTAQAFKVDSCISYFVVETDMESVIFWKIEPTETKSVKACGILFPFGGKYTQQGILSPGKVRVHSSELGEFEGVSVFLFTN